MALLIPPLIRPLTGPTTAPLDSGLPWESGSGSGGGSSLIPALPTANLVGDYNSTSPSFYTLTSSRVSAMLDQSPVGTNALSQAVAANRPTIAAAGGPTGQDAFDFSLNAGLGVSCANVSLGLSATCSIYCVTQTPGTSRYIYDGGAAADSRLAFNNVSGTQLVIFAGSQACTVACTPGTWIVDAAVFNGASSGQSVNGAALVTGNPGAGSDAGITFGGRQANDGAAGLNAKAIRMLVYSVAHSPAQVAAVYAYLHAWSGV